MKNIIILCEGQLKVQQSNWMRSGEHPKGQTRGLNVDLHTPTLFPPLLPSSLLKQKAFLTVFQSSPGSGQQHWLNTAHSVCTAATECSLVCGVREGGSGGSLQWRHAGGTVAYTLQPAVTKDNKPVATLRLKSKVFIRSVTCSKKWKKDHLYHTGALRKLTHNLR